MSTGGGNTQQAVDRLAGLIVAAINRRLAGMPSAPTSVSAGATASAASGNGGGVVSALSGFATKLLAILAPISVTAAVVGSATSGLSVFVGTLKLLGATFGTVLAPVFLLLAAVALSLSDVIQGQLLPNLAELQTQILQFGTNAVAALEGKFYELAVRALTLVIQLERLTETAGGLAGVFDKVMMVNNPLLWAGGKWLAGGGDGPDAKEQAQQELRALVAQLRGPGNAGAPAGGGRLNNQPPRPDFMGMVVGNLQTALDQMRHESGPKAQQTGLIQASLNAQMAAFMSPFERKQLELQEKNLQSLQEAVNAIKRLQPAVGN